MTSNRTQRAAQFARSSRAPSLGAKDPRWDRAAREGAAAQDFGAGLVLDRQSRLSLDVGTLPGEGLRVDRKGRIEVKKAARVVLPGDAPTWAVDLVRKLTDAGLMEK
jgi:hypothetical protein